MKSLLLLCTFLTFGSALASTTECSGIIEINYLNESGESEQAQIDKISSFKFSQTDIGVDLVLEGDQQNKMILKRIENNHYQQVDGPEFMNTKLNLSRVSVITGLNNERVKDIMKVEIESEDQSVGGVMTVKGYLECSI